MKAAVQSQATVVAGYQAAAAAGKMSEADATKAASDALRMARHGDLAGKPDYFYIVTTDGLAVMHPYLTRWVPGKSVLGTVNSKGIDAAKMLIDGMAASPDATAWVASWTAKRGDNDPNAVVYPKLQYLVKVPGRNWIVGSGLHVDGVEADVHSTALRQSGISLAVLAVIGVLGWLVTRSVLRQIGGEPSEQSDGIVQINKAVAQLDQMTRQNAALVEQSAPAAESLKDQAAALSNAVSTFKMA